MDKQLGPNGKPFTEVLRIGNRIKSEASLVFDIAHQMEDLGGSAQSLERLIQGTAERGGDPRDIWDRIDGFFNEKLAEFYKRMDIKRKSGYVDSEALDYMEEYGGRAEEYFTNLVNALWKIEIKRKNGKWVAKSERYGFH